MRKSSNHEQVKKDFPIGKVISFNDHECIVTNWAIINAWGENCLFSVLTKKDSGDFITLDLYEWGIYG